MNDEYRSTLLRKVFKENRKEYACHLQYVVDIGLRLARKFDADADVIETACLLHDIGRDKELPGEVHAQSGYRIAKELLAGGPFSSAQTNAILTAILHHNSDEVPGDVASQIVRTADAGSKVEYHEAFMLMCRKPTHQERLAWGMKYLEKGYAKICFDTYRQKIENKYQDIKSMYQQTLSKV
jgi:hypothetical protein